MNILVTGGAGYIGSVVVETLIGAGHQVVILDSLERGHLQAVHPQAKFYHGNVGDAELARRIFAENKIDAVIHLAGYLLVGESVEKPQIYFENNVAKPTVLVEQMLAAGVHTLIFSSTAAVYGAAEKTPIVETAETKPINPYGESKLEFEQYLFSAQQRGLKYAALRYFNAAGATQLNGEMHDPETHLIAVALQAAAGERPEIQLFGNDYPTPDGTNIRDYVHVEDIAAAHLAILEKLKNGELGATPADSLAMNAYNIGTGRGFSTKEVLDTVQQVTGKTLNIKIAPRRAGDPPVLVASAEKLSALGWQPKRSDLKQIIQSAWNWKKKQKSGIIDP